MPLFTENTTEPLYFVKLTKHRQKPFVTLRGFMAVKGVMWRVNPLSVTEIICGPSLIHS